MALSLERIIWYDVNSFLHVEIFVEEPFFPRQIAGNERWEVVNSLNLGEFRENFLVPIQRFPTRRQFCCGIFFPREKMLEMSPGRWGIVTGLVV